MMSRMTIIMEEFCLLRQAVSAADQSHYPNPA
jgi:hypothetical protein